ncbi:hypothetical protein Goklo_006255 [Gossypium klotzschianum]|uniref:Uncharacterized protein n=1 Tax=Gossypium klotzschianum TaxID=34286 RepID=A0A7J8VGZ8_9ROSI|nr:hypothetical protein [Gossypium klotzschianum]
MGMSATGLLRETLMGSRLLAAMVSQIRPSMLFGRT